MARRECGPFRVNLWTSSLLHKSVQLNLMVKEERNRVFVLDRFRVGLDSCVGGFFSYYQLTTNSVEFVDSITKSIDNGKQVGAIYTASSKSFGSLIHLLLIQQLKLIGSSPTMISLFLSYPYNCPKFFNFLGTTLKSGIPQGPNLGARLFNILLNDLLQSVRHLIYWVL